MSAIVRWLRVEPAGWALWKFFACTLISLLIFAWIIEVIYQALGFGTGRMDFAPLIQERVIFLFVLLPLLAAIEELIFRLPLVIFIKCNAPLGTIALAAILLSFEFGLAHGGWIGVPVQGIAGIVLCTVFLKCGGLQKKYLKAFFSGTFVHFAYNFITISLFLKFGI